MRSNSKIISRRAMKLLTSNEDKAKREKIIIASNKSSRSSFSPQFSTRVFGISSIIAIAGSTDHTRFYFEADAAAVTTIPASANFQQLVTECLNENNDGECPSWGASTYGGVRGCDHSK